MHRVLFLRRLCNYILDGATFDAIPSIAGARAGDGDGDGKMGRWDGMGYRRYSAEHDIYYCKVPPNRRFLRRHLLPELS